MGCGSGRQNLGVIDHHIRLESPNLAGGFAVDALHQGFHDPGVVGQGFNHRESLCRDDVFHGAGKLDFGINRVRAKRNVSGVSEIHLMPS